MDKDKFIDEFFKKLEEKPYITLVEGINNKKTFFNADKIHKALEETLEHFKGGKQ